MKQIFLGLALTFAATQGAFAKEPAVTHSECRQVWISADANGDRVLTPEEYARYYSGQAQNRERLALMNCGEPKAPFSSKL
ncbi:MAG: hypothetical protein AB7F96_18625 [Beijerinckiaceae bacterium]